MDAPRILNDSFACIFDTCARVSKQVPFMMTIFTDQDFMDKKRMKQGLENSLNYALKLLEESHEDSVAGD